MSRKEQLYRLFDNAAVRRFTGLLHKLSYEPANLLRVLMYHRVDEPTNRPHLNPALLSATPQNFNKQMRLIREQFNPISIYQLIAYYQGGQPLPPRSVLITFDDAYCDFEEHAFPSLKQYDIPVTLFVATAFPDHPEKLLWWDIVYDAIMNTRQTVAETMIGRLSLQNPAQRKTVFKQVREYVKSLPHSEAMDWVTQFCQQLNTAAQSGNSILGWDALRRLAAEGVTLAPHSHNHPMMNRITDETICSEVIQSRDILAREIDTDIPPVFAYPSGQVDANVVQLLRETGIDIAFTTERGINNLKHANPLLLKRVNVGSATPLSVLDAQLLSWVAFMK